MSGLEVDLRLRRGGSLALELALTVPPGRTVALLGPNGAGKSTALAAIAGLIAIERGRVALDGSVWDEPQSGVFVPPDRREVGVVFQDYLLFPHLTAGENVSFGLRRRGIARPEATRRAQEWLVKVGLGGKTNIRPTALSGGQAQRVALARALATHPRVLLLDEPLAALDVSTRVELRRTLAEHLRDFEGPRILVTHEPVEAFLLADEIHVLEAGVVTQSGPPDDIRLRPRTPYAADLGGANLLSGRAHGGSVVIGGHALEVAEQSIDGPVLVTIRPSAISLHLQRPEGSARNAWLTRIQALESLGERCRLQLAAPLPLTAEVTPGAVTALDLKVGSEVWVAVKATDIGVDHE